MTSTDYRRHEIRKRKGGTRTIAVPSARLARIQRAIVAHIVDARPVHEIAHAYRAGRGIHSNAAQHVDSAVIVKLDVSGFYPAIGVALVASLFEAAGYTARIAMRLAGFVTDGGALPQGAPSSPAISNAVCYAMDQQLAALAEFLGWRVTRYADDLTFSRSAQMDAALGPYNVRAEVEQLVSHVAITLSWWGFDLARAKTRTERANCRQTVTGLVVNGPGPPRPPRALRRAARAELHQDGRPGPRAARVAGFGT